MMNGRRMSGLSGTEHGKDTDITSGGALACVRLNPIDHAMLGDYQLVAPGLACDWGTQVWVDA